MRLSSWDGGTNATEWDANGLLAALWALWVAMRRMRVVLSRMSYQVIFILCVHGIHYCLVQTGMCVYPDNVIISFQKPSPMRM